MRSMEDKEMSNGSSITFDFHQGNGANRASNNPRTALGKPTPSKWDDAQKWLVGFSRNPSKTKPRNSNADDTRLIAPIPHQENEYITDDNQVQKVDNNESLQFDVHTKNVDCEEGFWRINKGVVENPGLGDRSVCVRDMGTEMTPIASKEPSRTATPIRATTPAARSPVSSGGSTPMRCQHGGQSTANHHTGSQLVESRNQASPLGRQNGANIVSNGEDEKNSVLALARHNPLETRALAWDEAERAKYMARYKREEVKIQAWEKP